jgi:hypothetical protein
MLQAPRKGMVTILAGLAEFERELRDNKLMRHQVPWWCPWLDANLAFIVRLAHTTKRL